MDAPEPLLLVPDGISPLVDESLDKYAALDTAERRRWRARFDPMAVVPRLGADETCLGVYDVLRPDHQSADAGDPPEVSRYHVDVEAGRCDCPFAQSDRTGLCKHLRRVMLEIRAERVPAPGEAAPSHRDRLKKAHAALVSRPDYREFRKALRWVLDENAATTVPAETA
jgi:hypothetical protein